MHKIVLFIDVTWDPEAKVWVTTADDEMPGLVAEADDLQALWDKLQRLVPELLEANGGLTTPNIEIELTVSRLFVVQRPGQ